jgi:hypothetical protein
MLKASLKSLNFCLIQLDMKSNGEAAVPLNEWNFGVWGGRKMRVGQEPSSDSLGAVWYCWRWRKGTEIGMSPASAHLAAACVSLHLPFQHQPCPCHTSTQFSRLHFNRQWSNSKTYLHATDVLLDPSWCIIKKMYMNIDDVFKSVKLVLIRTRLCIRNKPCSYMTMWTVYMCVL